jgi:acetolactate synthase-1/3 small subunit
MTIAVEGSSDDVKQCEKQLYKLIEVDSVRNVTNAPAITRELAMIKVRVGASDRPALAAAADIFRGEIVDVSKSYMIVQMTGGQDKIDRFINVISDYPIEEISRTGAIAMVRESAD